MVGKFIGQHHPMEEDEIVLVWSSLSEEEANKNPQEAMSQRQVPHM